MYTLVVLLSLFGRSPAFLDNCDQGKVQGEWYMVELNVREVLVSPEKLTGTVLIVKGDTYTTQVKKTKHTVTFKLDPTQSPKNIDMYFPDGTNAPKLSKGIYKIDGNRLIICRGQAADGTRPRDFVSSLTTDNFVVTWEKKPKK
ncbi:MAG: TIGR03067 domain-containing protein [Gemmataceae bacterium]|nr:TIGR03067 domain-containing protein [Gemmataceae bacterium]